MYCPKCNTNTRVLSSRRHDHPRGCLAARLAREAASWFTMDWVSRERKCKNPECDWRGATIELLTEDLTAGWRARYARRNK
jgi:hypothetical protein